MEFAQQQQRLQVEGVVNDPDQYIDALQAIYRGTTEDGEEITDVRQAYDRFAQIDGSHRNKLAEEFYAQKRRERTAAYQTFRRDQRIGEQWLEDRLEIVRGIALVDPNSRIASVKADLLLEYYQTSNNQFDTAVNNGTSIPNAFTLATSIYKKYWEQGLNNDVTVGVDELMSQIRPYLRIPQSQDAPFVETVRAIHQDFEAGEISQTQRMLYLLATARLQQGGADVFDVQEGLGLEPPSKPNTDSTPITTPDDPSLRRSVIEGLGDLGEWLEQRQRLSPEGE
jgi:hypothetical protein